MSRNGSGTYSKVNTFVSGTTITASDHNENWDDAALEITNSVAADGQTSMTGPLKHSSGTALAPSMTFAADTDSGIYRSASNEVSVSVGGAQSLIIGPNGITVVGTVGVTDVSGFIITALIGEAKIWLLPTAPTGWIYSFGQACTTAYPLWRAALVAAGNPFGTSGGDPLFPDLRGRLIAGRDDMGLTAASRITSAGSGITGTSLGASGGAENVAIAQGNLPSYTLPNTLSWSMSGVNAFGVSNSTISVRSDSPSGTAIKSDAFTNLSVTGTISGSVTSGGSGTALNKMPPTFIVNFIVRAA